MAFGKKGQISSEIRNFGVAIGWDRPPQVSRCLSIPKVVNSTDAQILTLVDVLIDPEVFLSVIVCDRDGFVIGERCNVNNIF